MHFSLADEPMAPFNGGAETHGVPSGCRRVLDAFLCPFRAVVYFILFDSFVPTDSYITKVRKVIAGTMVIAFLTYGVNYLQFAEVIANPASTEDQRMHAYIELAIVDLFTSIPFLGSFIYCRVTKSAPDPIIAIPMLCTMVGNIVYVLGTATICDIVPIVSICVVTIITRVHWVWTVLTMIGAFIALVLNGLNISRTVTWLLPGARAPYEPQGLFDYFSNQGVFSVIVMLFLHVVVREFEAMIARANGAAEVSRELATLLQQYDTDGANLLLDRCRRTNNGHHDNDDRGGSSSSKGATALVVDPSLLDAFSGIVRNLERYKPHLPNYVLDPPTTVESPHEMHISSFNASETTDNPLLGATASTVDNGGDKEPRRLSIVPGGESPLPAPVNARNPSGAAGTAAANPHRGNIVTLDHATEVFRTPLGGAPRMMDLRLGSLAVESKVAATVAEIAVTEGCPDRKEALDIVVAAIHSAATGTHGSVHGFLGDRLVVTWNATKKITKPEARACTFALRLQAALIRDGAATMSSMTATAFAESCFAGDQRLQLFKCTSKRLWDVAREGLNRTRHLRVAAMDDATREQASVDVRSRGLALLKKEAGQAPVCLYELIGERDDTDDVEWMYRLERNAHDPDELVSDALRLYAAFHVQEALSTMRRAVDMKSSEPCQGMQELLKEMEQEAVRD